MLFLHPHLMALSLVPLNTGFMACENFVNEQFSTVHWPTLVVHLPVQLNRIHGWTRFWDSSREYRIPSVGASKEALLTEVVKSDAE